MLTAEQANQRPYRGGGAGTKGMTSDDFRTQMRLHGERVRWWKAYRPAEGIAWSGLEGPGGEHPTSQGLLLIEQPLDSAVRVQMYSNREEVVDESFGLIRIGTTMIACVPDEIELSRGDRVLGLDRTKLEREVIEQDSTLSRQFPASITRIVSVSTGVIDANTYTLDGRTIDWVGTPPSGVLLVDYRFYPVYEFQEAMNRQGPLGSDNKRLPQHGALRLLSVGEEAME